MRYRCQRALFRNVKFYCPGHGGGFTNMNRLLLPRVWTEPVAKFIKEMEL